MSAGTCASLCCALLLVGVSVSAGQETITAEPGQNIILPCRAPNKNQIRAVVWAKPDLEDEHVYLYRDGRFDPGEQNPVYRNRVDLQDRQMKDGDVSLIMKDVTLNDSGTYECRVIQIEASRSIKAPSIIIYLRVVAPPGPGGGTTEDGGNEDGGKEDGGKEDGSVGLIVCLSVSAVLFVAAAAVAAFLICRKLHSGFTFVSRTDYDDGKC
ncbi:myelin-oligodendrocyte glycoprotein-like [Archocentrus centrarchus]|uniref:myelin-oligodendrocyte glycoprotein-like n=1 Tax=Archocentrus centrarchus TaxID=63155 RepID=UPI0011E9F2D4|nr:myelin-oligodendrocyte glycoprotein-like [Archocentrus centrarchus]